MTNEERWELIAKLRWYGARLEKELSGSMRDAANEIERLAREREEIIKSSDAVCDSYAKENQRLSDKIERLARERDEVIKSSDAVCDSYAKENQRLSDKIERYLYASMMSLTCRTWDR